MSQLIAGKYRENLTFLIVFTLLMLCALSAFLIKHNSVTMSIRVNIWLTAGTKGANAGIREINLEVGHYFPDMESFNLTDQLDMPCADIKYWMTIVLNESAFQPLVWNYSISLKPSNVSNYVGYVTHSVQVIGTYRLTINIYVEVNGVSRIAESKSQYIELF